MDPEVQAEEGEESRFCPECGAEESGYFCRTCGTLLRGEEMVLCPRCHHVVPDGDFCNLCGQTLGGIALNLRQSTRPAALVRVRRAASPRIGS